MKKKKQERMNVCLLFGRERRCLVFSREKKTKQTKVWKNSCDFILILLHEYKKWKESEEGESGLPLLNR